VRVFFAVALALWTLATYGAAADVQALISEGKLQPALDRVEADLARNKSDVSLQFLKGLVLTRMNRLDQAAEVFQRITEEHPELPEPFSNLAVVHAARGDFEAAQKALQMAINTHPSYATAHENLGDIYAKMASQAYNHALQLDEGNSSAKAKLALINDLFPVPASRNVPGKVTAVAAAPPVNPAPATGGVPAVPAASQPQPLPQARPSPPTLPPQTVIADTAPAPTPAPVPAPEAEPAPASAPPPAAAVEASVEPELRAAVEAWAKAWSARDVDAYLAAYGAEFEPADGTRLEQWEQTRRKRLQQSSFIKVELTDVKIVEHGPEHAQVSFDQHYESDAFRDVVRKTLIMKKVGADWKIVEETVR
jgi:tetratricopeptide (TPR) repeat protein